MPRRTRPAFTLVELLVALAGTALLITLAAPTLSGLRTDARLAGSVDNLRTLGKANASYADANDGNISGYDWDFEDGEFQPGPFGGTYLFDIGGGETGPTVEARDRLEIAQAQQAGVLRRATGRFDNPQALWVNFNRIPHRRYSHLPLLDWFGGSVSDPLAVSPLDMHQQAFQTNPLDYDALPGGDPDTAADGWDDSPQIINRWPFASSYQTTVYAWTPSRPIDGAQMAIAPTGDSTLILVNDLNAFGTQPMADVAFPSNKAHFFEEFDYSNGLGVNGRYFAAPDASVNVLFFDGSARLVASADANPGWDAGDPCNMNSTPRVVYEPIDTRYFPTHDDLDELPQPFRWTRGGLEGTDVGAGEINTADWCD